MKSNSNKLYENIMRGVRIALRESLQPLNELDDNTEYEMYRKATSLTMFVDDLCKELAGRPDSIYNLPYLLNYVGVYTKENPNPKKFTDEDWNKVAFAYNWEKIKKCRDVVIKNSDSPAEMKEVWNYIVDQAQKKHKADDTWSLWKAITLIYIRALSTKNNYKNNHAKGLTNDSKPSDWSL